MHSTHKIQEKCSHVWYSSRAMLLGNAIIHEENQNITLHMVYQNYADHHSHAVE
jgi:hypothetical protein